MRHALRLASRLGLPAGRPFGTRRDARHAPVPAPDAPLARMPAGPPAACPPLEEERLPGAKRALDLVLGSLLLVLAAPALLVAAAVLAVRGDAAGVGRFGRVLRRQEVVGLHGAPFTLRSLPTRRFRLDLLSRLPQVVRGRMSLVGPAALPVGHPRARAGWRQSVRPGITGLAQVRRGSRLPWYEAPLLDQHYVEHHWLGTDLAILAVTLPSLPPTATSPKPGASRAPRTSRTSRTSRSLRETPRERAARARGGRTTGALSTGARAALGRAALARTARARATRAARARGARTREAASTTHAGQGSRSAHGRVTVSDTDHRSGRYIAAG
ncbi:sugar transferase [Streptomyces sp. NRRL F-5126]|uniref:sugar transferase n=1 Tax=Streptomyces sp. NRRL F-5126 TaxID=1463857 RepID=UPI00068B139A|nr:sugar transferase [Streptomyces sp. NRRL F-5126]